VAAGKSVICAGVGKHLLDDGKNVGFLKPVIAEKKAQPSGDAVFMKQVLNLPESVESVCPAFSDESSLLSKIKDACSGVSQGKDVVLIEGISGQNKLSADVAEALKAKVIVVADYSRQVPAAKLSNGYKEFGENLLGVVLNKVPVSQLKRVSEELSPLFDKAGVTLLGIIPEDRKLFSLTVGELTDAVQGDILNDAEKSADLVENLMAGAMYVDSGLDYFGRKNNKAVVVRSDRPDMQMAALETSTKCLVLSGSEEPIDYVRAKAADRGVPVISTRSDTISVIQSIEDALSTARLNQAKKLPGLVEITEKNLDFKAVYQGLGI
ncbi:DRTGG domain-containing protein, partial [Chloroflexota bacterium]